MITRTTTVGILKGYRYDLNRSNNTMAKRMNTVITGRTFNSYAEDPAVATRCFQMRRTFMRTATQLKVNDSIKRKFDVAWAAMDTISQDVDTVAKDTVFQGILTGLNDPDASGRNALGQSMTAKAKSMVQTMNGRYGENYVFSGADTLNVPFTWGPKKNPAYLEGTPDPTNEDHAAAFKYMADPAKTGDAAILYTDDPAMAVEVSEPNPDYNEGYTKEVDALAPDIPPEKLEDPRYGQFLRPDGTNTNVEAEANKVPKENEKYNRTYEFKYLKDDGSGTNVKDEAASGLYYRGVSVDSMDPADQEKLNYFTKGETKYQDIGLGHKESNGDAVTSTVFDSALQGIYYLGGFGTEKVTSTVGEPPYSFTKEVEVPNNIVSQVARMGAILQRCDPDNGKFASEEEEAEFMALAKKFEETKSLVKQRWDEMDTESGFLRDNTEMLTDTAESVSLQFMALEDVDPAAAISDYMFARYCYDTALKVGNSVLSQSLMDYMSL
ncbi:hypothetical protein AALC17_07260 [Oscillospiraceae bacterium 38-13]